MKAVNKWFKENNDNDEITEQYEYTEDNKQTNKYDTRFYTSPSVTDSYVIILKQNIKYTPESHKPSGKNHVKDCNDKEHKNTKNPHAKIDKTSWGGGLIIPTRNIPMKTKNDTPKDETPLNK